MKILDNLPEVGLLTREAEDALANNGDEESLNELILHHMREAFVYTRQVCKGKLPDDEIYSMCYIALQKSVRNFRPDVPGHARFFAYSKPYLRGELSREWASKDVVKNSSLHEDADTPTNLWPTHTVDGGPRELDWTEPDFDSITAHERWATVSPIMDKVLSDHEKMVLTLNYGSGFSFTTIAELLNMSRSAVGETHTRAIGKIRSELTRSGALFEDEDPRARPRH